MPNHLIVWDIETVPDLRGFAAANGHDGKADHEIREAMGEKFPKHIYHSIICIGALVAHCDNGHWQVDALGAPHIGERSEKELITGFVNRIAPQGQHIAIAQEMAAKIAGSAPLVVQGLKRLARDAMPKGPLETVAEGRRILDPIRTREDVKEGVAAFREKRKPRFKGK